MAEAVLLITDDIALAHTCADALPPPTYGLTHESTAGQGLVRGLAASALVLADLAVPDRPVDLVARLVARDRIVIAVGSPADPVGAADALDAGAVQFLAKPVDPRLLRAAVQRALEGSGGPGLSVAEAERRQIVRALRVHGGNRTHAARALGVARATLIKKIKQYQLDA